MAWIGDEYDGYNFWGKPPVGNRHPKLVIKITHLADAPNQGCCPQTVGMVNQKSLEKIHFNTLQVRGCRLNEPAPFFRSEKRRFGAINGYRYAYLIKYLEGLLQDI